MRCGWFAGLLGAMTLGCAAAPPFLIENPLEIPRQNYNIVWERTVNVIDDYLQIAEENRIDGRIETLPKVGSTLLEPWNKDSVNTAERVESTLQTIRRRAIVRITPTQQGYALDVQVIKELEDLPHPQYASAGEATFLHSASVTRRRDVVSDEVRSAGWITLGRDFALEQELMRRLQEVLVAGVVADF